MAVRQASLSFTISWSLLKLLFTESVMPSNHLILCRPLLLLPSIFPSIKIFSNELALCIRWPKYWSFSFSQSQYLKLGLDALSAPNELENSYFCCILAVQPERGRCGSRAKALPTLVTVPAFSSHRCRMSVKAAEKTPDSGQDGETQAKQRTESSAERERRQHISPKIM